MKKIMMTAAAVALAGVATAGNVFDYKASVKYVDFKQVTSAKVWVKTVKSTTLKGYLVTPTTCACSWCADERSGRDPGFLVITSPLAKKYDSAHPVKLMPANLIADMWALKDLNIGSFKTATLEAQGYLFAGLGKTATFEQGAGEITSPAYGFGEVNYTEATRYLFGQANQADTDGSFIEPFLDAAGFGKGYWSREQIKDEDICGKSDPTVPGYACLKSLAGSVIGGSYSCRANGFYEVFRCQGWNDEGDWDGFDYKYNVVSGTWSIKETSKFDSVLPKTTDYLVTACGQKLFGGFSLYTFDNYTNAVEDLAGMFYPKWFNY